MRVVCKIEETIAFVFFFCFLSEKVPVRGRSGEHCAGPCEAITTLAQCKQAVTDLEIEYIGEQEIEIMTMVTGCSISRAKNNRINLNHLFGGTPSNEETPICMCPKDYGITLCWDIFVETFLSALFVYTFFLEHFLWVRFVGIVCRHFLFLYFCWNIFVAIFCRHFVFVHFCWNIFVAMFCWNFFVGIGLCCFPIFVFCDFQSNLLKNKKMSRCNIYCVEKIFWFSVPKIYL